jgi:diacylglycerol O-acyltransferase / wax synthase
MNPLARLSAADLTNLALEAADTPMHQAVLAVVEAGPLRGPDGRVLIERLREHIASRLERVPQLRQVVFRPGLLRGRPLLVDYPRFRIEEHVLLETLPEPGGEAAAFAFAERQMAARFDRSRPLWAIWILDGYAPDRVALLIKLHHAIADGPAMVNMLAQVFDIEPLPAARGATAWTPAPPPRGGELLLDNVAQRMATLRRWIVGLLHPRRTFHAAFIAARALLEEWRQADGAPRTSLNRPVGVGRRVRAMHVSLEEAKAISHRLGVKLNDVFLFVVARGLRAALSGRGENVREMTLHMSIAVTRPSVRSATVSGNHVGTVLVPVPVGVDDPRAELRSIAAAAAQAKTRQEASLSTELMVVLAETGIARAFTRRQHMLNVLTTNLPGPPVPLYLAGGRVESPVAMAPIAGNVTLSFAALSYERALCFSLVADAAAWPDLAAVTDGMASGWRELQAAASAPNAAAKSDVSTSGSATRLRSVTAPMVSEPA